MIRHLSFRRSVAPVLLLAALVAPPSSAAQQVVDLAARDVSLDAVVQDVFRVGGVDAPEWAAWRALLWVDFDGTGRLYVFDHTGGRVLVTTPGGAFLRQIGRPGQGPGELESPTSFAVQDDGTVSVFSFSRGFYSVFDAGGEFVRNVPVDVATGFPGKDAWADPLGGIVSPQIGLGRQEMRFDPQRSGVRIHRYLLDDAGTTELLFQGERPRRDFSGGRTFDDIMANPGWRAFEPEYLLGVLADGGLAVAEDVAYAVKVVGPDGELRRVLRRAIDPIPVTRRIQEEARDRKRREIASGSAGGSVSMSRSGEDDQDRERPVVSPDTEERIQGMRFPERLSVITGLGVDSQGRIWVQRRGPGPWDDGPIDVLTPDGKYLGSIPAGLIPFPDAFGPDGRVAFIRKDDLDVPWVEVKRVVLSGGG